MGWLKLNLDAAYKDKGNIATGGVLRDWTSHWVQGYHRKLRIGSVVLVELLGILDGLKLAWEFGYRQVWIEIDSTEALELIEHGCLRNNPNYLLMEAIKDILSRDWSIK